LYSINYAYYNSKFIKKSVFIIKITGRYFLPDLENILTNFDLNVFDCIRQNSPDFCELVGCHINHFHKIFNPYLVNEKNEIHLHVENIFKMRISWFNNIINLPPIIIDPPTHTGYLWLRQYL
jgi:hypothetical protein